MRKITVDASEDGRRLDHVLRNLLPEATQAFFHKMLRKKNIVVNDGRSEGAYRVRRGDEITLYLSEETMDRFSKPAQRITEETERFAKAFAVLRGDAGAGIRIVYEDDALMLLNKPAGILSQRAGGNDLSVNEWIVGYLLENGKMDEAQLGQFRPSVANRLDRGTSGLMIAVKTRAAARQMAMLQREGLLVKEYLAVVSGCVEEDFTLTGGLTKDRARNRSFVTETNAVAAPAEEKERLRARVLAVNPAERVSLLSLVLLDGKSHQIRAQLAHRGFPVLGDRKYGDGLRNREMSRRYGLHTQLLHSAKLTFPPELPEVFAPLSGKGFTAEAPQVFRDVRAAFFETKERV